MPTAYDYSTLVWNTCTCDIIICHTVMPEHLCLWWGRIIPGLRLYWSNKCTTSNCLFLIICHKIVIRPCDAPIICWCTACVANVFVYDYDRSHVSLIRARGLYTYGGRHLVELSNIGITRCSLVSTQWLGAWNLERKNPTLSILIWLNRGLSIIERHAKIYIQD